MTDIRDSYYFGVDFAGDSKRVVAVQVGGGAEIKYGLTWIGPLDLGDPEVAADFASWAEWMLDLGGGYIHLLPADGDAAVELRGYVEEQRELDAE